MELLVVRHAVAFERNPERWPDDGARPLSPRGRARARKAATGLARLAPRPQRVLVSPLRRAQQTAAILSEYAGWPAASPCPALAPGVASAALLQALRRIPASPIALVGHEPDLGRLLALCLGGSGATGALPLKKMGAALLAFEGTARAGTARLAWLLPPRILRAAR
jgi:phosphohistidine phosphatase